MIWYQYKLIKLSYCFECIHYSNKIHLERHWKHFTITNVNTGRNLHGGIEYCSSIGWSVWLWIYYQFTLSCVIIIVKAYLQISCIHVSDSINSVFFSMVLHREINSLQKRLALSYNWEYIVLKSISSGKFAMHSGV